MAKECVMPLEDPPRKTDSDDNKESSPPPDSQDLAGWLDKHTYAIRAYHYWFQHHRAEMSRLEEQHLLQVALLKVEQEILHLILHHTEQIHMMANRMGIIVDHQCAIKQAETDLLPECCQCAPPAPEQAWQWLLANPGVADFLSTPLPDSFKEFLYE